MFEYWKDNYVVHNIDWTMEKAKLILDEWQKKFTEVVTKYFLTICSYNLWMLCASVFIFSVIV